jgi:hypothetical protein
MTTLDHRVAVVMPYVAWAAAILVTALTFAVYAH